MDFIAKIFKGGGAALIISILVVNSIVYFCHRYPGWIDRNQAATNAIWNPGTTVIHGKEGRGIYHVDENGYLNEGKLIEHGYILTVGASHTQGKEVASGLRFSDLLNARFTENEYLKVYNVSQDGFFFPDIVKNFKALIQEFPKSESIIIETGKTDFTIDELKEAFNQREFSEQQRGTKIIAGLPLKKKIVMKVKENFPLLKVILNQFAIMKDKTTVETKGKTKEAVLDVKEYEQSLDAALALIRSEYKGNLIICYHPAVSITNDGLSIRYERNTPVFKKLCEDNNIIFVDTSEAFLRDYKNHYAVPYGFANTTMGTGHLNADGHRVIAEELYKVLTSLEDLAQEGAK